MSKHDSEVWADALIGAIELNYSYGVKIDDDFFRDWFAEAWRHGLRDVTGEIRAGLTRIVEIDRGMYPYVKERVMAGIAQELLDEIPPLELNDDYQQ